MQHIQSPSFKKGHSKMRYCGIVKDGLRIGKSIIFKLKHILRYFHVVCAFGSFQKARIAKNVISDRSQLDGADNLNDQEKSLLSEFIEKENKSRATPLPEINYTQCKLQLKFAEHSLSQHQCQVQTLCLLMLIS